MKVLTNKRQVFVKILKEICRELDYNIQFLSQNWIAKISKNNITNYIISYNFGINKDASSKICADKSATSEILTLHNIPNITHKIFHVHNNYHGDIGNWQKMIIFFKTHNNKVVIKPNVGSSGSGVIFIDTLYRLESETYKIMSKKSSFCLSPFFDILEEYQVVMLKNQPKLIFRKRKPTLIGNGKDTILNLINKSYKLTDLPIQALETLKEKKLGLETILANNEVIELNWKHNLGSGAIPEIIEINNANKNVVEIAKKAIKALEMSFASVDIVETKNDGYKVIEVNSGVMLTNFASHSEEGYQLAKGIYSSAIKLMIKR